MTGVLARCAADVLEVDGSVFLLLGTATCLSFKLLSVLDLFTAAGLGIGFYIGPAAGLGDVVSQIDGVGGLWGRLLAAVR